MKIVCDEGEIDEQTIDWTVPGDTFYDFDPFASSVRVEPLIDETHLKGKPEIKFYWANDPGEKKVEVTFKLKSGKDCSEDATLKVKPITTTFDDPDQTARLGHVSAYHSYQEKIESGGSRDVSIGTTIISLSNVDHPNENEVMRSNGIISELTVNAPDFSEKANYINFCQILTSSRDAKNEFGDAVVKATYPSSGGPPEPVLDTSFPFLPVAIPADGSPAFFLDSNPGRKIRFADRWTGSRFHKTYLMFKPDPTIVPREANPLENESRWVPLAAFTWKFSYCAQKEPPDQAIVIHPDGGTRSATPWAAESEFPFWTSNIENVIETKEPPIGPCDP